VIGQADAVWSVTAAHELSFGARIAWTASDRTSLSPADSTDYAEARRPARSRRARA
jgi:hypothetical protein